MKTFLVPVDFSPVSKDIIDTAQSFCRAFPGKVVLLHSIPPPIVTSEYALPMEAVQEAVMAGEKAAQTKLEQYKELFEKNKIETETIVRQGSPVFTILDEAKRTKADFIIMGSHGHGKLYDLFVGSTASGVLKNAPCGVIILPPDKEAE